MIIVRHNKGSANDMHRVQNPRLTIALGVVALAVATFRLAYLVLDWSGLLDRWLYFSGPPHLAALEIGLVYVPSALWVLLVFGLWTLHRESSGSMLLLLAVGFVAATAIFSAAIDMVGSLRIENALTWPVVFFTVLAPLVLALAIARTRLFPAPTTALGLIWGIGFVVWYAAITLPRVRAEMAHFRGIERLAARLPFAAPTLLVDSGRPLTPDIWGFYALSVVSIAFIVGIGLSLVRQGAGHRRSVA